MNGTARLLLEKGDFPIRVLNRKTDFLASLFTLAGRYFDRFRGRPDGEGQLESDPSLPDPPTTLSSCVSLSSHSLRF